MHLGCSIGLAANKGRFFKQFYPRVLTYWLAYLYRQESNLAVSPSPVKIILLSVFIWCTAGHVGIGNF
jgi:hypothetical protein